MQKTWLDEVFDGVNADISNWPEWKFTEETRKAIIHNKEKEKALAIKKKANLKQAQSEELITVLNLTLANLTVLAQKTRHFHWNLLGPHFEVYHTKFGELYELLSTHADLVAEHVRQLHSVPIHTLGGMLEITQLHEEPTPNPDCEYMISVLIEDLEMLLNNFKAVIMVAEPINERSSPVLADDLTAIWLKELWKLRAFLGKV